MADDPLTPARSLTLDREHQALFVSDRGGGFGALDVIEDGRASGGHRGPVIAEILATSPLPFHRVVAAMILCAWARPEGLHAVVDWCEHPNGSPASEQMETFDRFSLAYNGYELLANGLGAAEADSRVAELHVAAVRALISVMPRRYVGRHVADAVETVADRWPDIADSVSVSVTRLLDQLRHLDGRVDDHIDLGFQTGALIGVQARHDDEAGTASMREFLAIDTGERAEREAIYSLRHSRGPRARLLLDELAAGTGPRARVAAETLIAQQRPYLAHPTAPAIDPGAPDEPRQP